MYRGTDRNNGSASRQLVRVATLGPPPGGSPPALTAPRSVVPAAATRLGPGTAAYHLVTVPTLGLVTMVAGIGAILTTCLAVVVDAVALASAVRLLGVLTPPLRRPVHRGHRTG